MVNELCPRCVRQVRPGELFKSATYWKPVCRTCLLELDESQPKEVSYTYSRWSCSHVHQPLKFPDGKRRIYLSAYMDVKRPMPGAMHLFFDQVWAGREVLITGNVVPPEIQREISTSRNPTIIWPWPDHSTPLNKKQFFRVIKILHKLARSGKRIEIGCVGGHGRTGTAAALFLILEGLTATKAIRYIHSQYCPSAIESVSQMELIYEFDEEVNGVKRRIPKSIRELFEVSTLSWGGFSNEYFELGLSQLEWMNFKIHADVDEYLKLYGQSWLRTTKFDEWLASQDSENVQEINETETVELANKLCVEKKCADPVRCIFERLGCEKMRS